MGLRRSTRLLILYIYRRLPSLIRNSRHSPFIIIIILIFYLIFFVFIQDKAMPSSSTSISENNNPRYQRLKLKKYQNYTLIRESPSLFISTTNNTNVSNQSRVMISPEARQRYSFIDIDHLDVHIQYLDEIYTPPIDLNIELPNPKSHPYSRLLNVKGDPSTIIYNRIPQCYEFTMGSLLQNVSYFHSYTYISSEIYSPFSYNRSALILIAKSLNQHKYNQLLLYERHIYFFDFYNLTFPSHPVWINLVRDPMYRVAADFHASRIVCQLTNRCFVKKERVKDTLDTCVLKYSPRECISASNGVSRMVPFFCGLTQTMNCEEDTSWALQQAKQNIDFFYTVIGVAEQFYSFLYVLEKLLPQYFKLARLIFMNQRDQEHLVDERDTYIRLPNSRTTNLLKPLLQYEYELYDYIKQRFLDQYRILTELDN